MATVFRTCVVHKFGGTTLDLDGSGHRLALDIIADQGTVNEEPTNTLSASSSQDLTLGQPARLSSLQIPAQLSQIIVVSALSNVTDALLKMVDQAVTQSSAYLGGLDELIKKHTNLAQQLLPGPENEQRLASLEKQLSEDAEDIRDVLHAIMLSRQPIEALRDLVLAQGELWSSRIFALYLQANNYSTALLDARQVLTVERDPHAESPLVAWSTTEQQMQNWLNDLDPTVSIIVVTGYIARTSSGATTTLRRKGSDFSASIFGYLFKARQITLWTNFDGIYSADPSFVKGAYLLPELTYAELLEFSFYGSSSVVHPKTMTPALTASIPIWIRNSFNRTCKGTKIHAGNPIDLQTLRPRDAVRGFVTRSAVALLTIQGVAVTIGDPTPLHERNNLLHALKNASIPVFMILQAAAENNLRLCVPEPLAAMAKDIVTQHFQKEIEAKLILSVSYSPGYAIITAIGDHISKVPGVASRFFSSLQRKAINVDGIAQNGERIISALISDSQLVRAVEAVHAIFRVRPYTLSLAIFSDSQLETSTALMKRLKTYASSTDALQSFEVCAIMVDKRMLLSYDITLDNWKDKLAQEGEPCDLASLMRHMAVISGYEAVIVDCTNSRDLGQHYTKWLEEGMYVITSNRHALVSSSSVLKSIFDIERRTQRFCLMDEAVTNAFPLVSMLKDTFNTTDELIELSFMLSPVVALVLSTVESALASGASDDRSLGKKLASVCHAINPKNIRDALTGIDSVRKMCILAQVCGVDLTLEDIEVDKLVPSDFLQSQQSKEDAWEQVARSLKQRIQLLNQQQQQQNGAIRFIARLKVGDSRSFSASVVLERVTTKVLASIPSSHVFAVVFSKQHEQSPFVIQATASAALASADAKNIFADCLQLADRIRPE